MNLARRGLSLFVASCILFSVAVPAANAEEILPAEAVAEQPSTIAEVQPSPEEIPAEEEIPGESVDVADIAGTPGDGTAANSEEEPFITSEEKYGNLTEQSEIQPVAAETQWQEEVEAVALPRRNAAVKKSGRCGDFLQYTLYDDGVLHITGTGTMKDYGCNSSPWYDNTFIREIRIDHGVTSIGRYAFEGCSGLTNVTIPASVKSIGNSSFFGCSSLTEMELPEGVESIGDGAFYNCTGLQSIAIPASLLFIEYESYCEVFHDCPIKAISYGGSTTQWKRLGLVFPEAEVTCSTTGSCGENVRYSLSDGVLEITGTGAISNYDSGMGGWLGFIPACSPWYYEAASIKEIHIADGITDIGNFAFEGCSNLTGITIPAGVTRVGNGAFNGCFNLAEIVIPDSLTVVERDCDNIRDAFSDCPVATVLYDGTPAQWAELGLSFSGAKVIYRLSGRCGENIRYTLLDGVLEIIGTGAMDDFSQCGSPWFANATAITEVQIGAGVTGIGDFAFYGCSELAEIAIPDGVATIGRAAFYDCGKLADVDLPDGVTDIGAGVFHGCSGLSSISLPPAVAGISDNLFEGCSGLTSVTIPGGVVSIGEAAFRDCSSLTDIAIPGGVRDIRAYTFGNCRSLREIALPDGITGIGSFAFGGCSNLAKIVIPDSVTDVGQGAFKNCEKLNDITLGAGMTAIPDSAFDGCSALEKVVIPHNITTIHNNAFANCPKLTSVTIPQSVTEIGPDTVFTYPSGVIICGFSGTAAETYARNHNIPFVDCRVPAETVTLDKTDIILPIGETCELAVSVNPENCTDEVKWRSTDAGVVTVTAEGQIMGVAVGEADVVAEAGSIEAVCRVMVPQPVTEISLNETDLTMRALDTFALVATVSPDNAFNKEIGWDCSDTKIATVDENGMVTALSKGTAIVTARAMDGSGKTATCKITVKNSVVVASSVEQLESEHNYADNSEDSWFYTIPGAKKIGLTFDERTSLERKSDRLYILDGDGNMVGKYTGDELAGKRVIVEGNTVCLRLESDGSVTSWGFKVTDAKSMVDGTILFDPNGGILDVFEKSVYVGDAIAQLPEPIGVGALFDGWFTQPEGGEEITGDYVMNSAETLTLYAHWEVKYTTAPVTADLDPAEPVEPGTRLNLTTATNGAEIYYAYVAGDEVGEEYLYEDAIILSEAIADADSHVTIQAYAVKDGYKPSEVETFTYTVIDYSDDWGDVTEDDQLAVGDMANIPEQLWVAGVEDADYTGAAITYPGLRVYWYKQLLVLNKDYTVKYTNNVKAGTARVTITGKGNYAGTINHDFTIHPLELGKATLAKTFVRFKYNGKVQKATNTLTYDLNDKTVTLKAGTDFTYVYPGTTAKQPDYDANAFKAAGNYTVNIVGKGNYTGGTSFEQEITPCTLVGTLAYSIGNNVFDRGNPVAPKTLTVKHGSKLLSGYPVADAAEAETALATLEVQEGYDYVYYCTDNVEVGKASITFVGVPARGYIDTVTKNYNVTGYQLGKMAFKNFPASKPWNNGEAINPFTFAENAAYLLNGKVELAGIEAEEYETLDDVKKRDFDYTYTIENNVNIGKATITMNGVNGYSGKVVKTFNITGYQLSKMAFKNFPASKPWSGEAINPFEFEENAAYIANGTVKPVLDGIEESDYESLPDGEKLKVDYTYSITNNVEVGKATITLNGVNGYSGKVVKTFNITGYQLGKMAFKNFPASKPWNGEAINPFEFGENKAYIANGTVKPMLDGIEESVYESLLPDKKLNYDYTYSIANNVEVGKATITMNGVNGYSGKVVKTFNITGYQLGKMAFKNFAASYLWTGSEIDPFVLAEEKAAYLANGTIKPMLNGVKESDYESLTDEEKLAYDYTYNIVNNVAIGKATITLNGVNGYSGKVVKTFNVTGTAIGAIRVEGLLASYGYTGEAIEPVPTKVYFAATKTAPERELVEGFDYTVTYLNNVKVGTGTVVITGINAYTGVVKKTFKITAHTMANVAGSRITVDAIGTLPYVKGGVKPVVAVYDGSTELVLNKDYTVKYANNAAANGAKAPTVTITGKGNYTGSRAVTFVIQKQNLANMTMTATDVIYQNKANICKPTITLTDLNNTKLAAKTDYNATIAYTYAKDVRVTQLVNKQYVPIVRSEGSPVDAKDIIPVGAEIRATAKGVNNYEGEQSVVFRFAAGNIASAAVTVLAQTYTGKAIQPDKNAITVKMGKTVLNNCDYEIVGYANNVNKGTGKVTIRGIGNYTGTKTVNFNIVNKSMNYTVVYDSNNEYMAGEKPYAAAATGTMKNGSIASGTKLAGNAYKRNGYTFAGWNTRWDGSGVSYANAAAFTSTLPYGSQVVLYAQWTPVTYKITYANMSGAVGNTNVTTYTVEDEVMFDGAYDIEKPYYTLVGWYSDSALKKPIYGLSQGTVGNKTIYPKWQKNLG